MAVGNWTIFDRGALKLSQGVIDLDTHSFKLILCGTSQAFTKAFTGSSTDCRYSDITGELSTANGYTAGGLALSGLTLTQAGSTVTWSASDASWTLSGSLVFKWGLIYDDTNANKDLLCFFDANDASGSSTVTASVSPLTLGLLSGILDINT